MSRGFLLTVLLLIVSCGNDAQKEDQRTTQLDVGNPEAEMSRLNYQKDVLPILESNVNGKAHKCTVCHNWMYREISQEQAKLIIDSIEKGSMPPRGQFDQVSGTDLETITRWFEQNFK